MTKIQLDAGRRSFAVLRDGIETNWEYDVLEIKLTAEELERKQGMRQGDEVMPPTVDFLRELASRLAGDFGLDDCTSDVAFRIYNVVNAQFVAMSASIEEQVRSISV